MAWEQVSNAIKFYAFFVASKAGKSGLTPTVYVLRNGTAIVTAGSAVEVDATNAPGLYSYELASGSVTVEGEYIAIFRTADATVDAQHIPSLWIVGRAGVEDLDATISSRNATTPPTAAANATAVRSELATELARVDVAISTRNATTPPTAGAVADAVWDEALAGHTTAGSAGPALSAAGSASDPLLNPVGSYVAPQAGYYLQRLANNEVQLVSIYNPTDMSLTYYYGDDYYATDGREQDFTTTYTLTGGTVTLAVRTATALVEIPCSIVDAHTYRVELSAANLATIGVGVWTYDLQMKLPTSVHGITEVFGAFLVNPDVR